MALEGTLKDFSLSDILQLIAFQRKTGELLVKSGGETVRLLFHAGQIVTADSSKKMPQNQLGAILVRSGRLKEEELAEAIAVQAESHEHLGTVLRSMLLCRSEDISLALDVQLKRVVFNVFRWKSGEFIFRALDHVDYEENLILPLGIESVLMESAQMIDEWPKVAAVAESLEVVFNRRTIVRTAGAGAGASGSHPGLPGSTGDEEFASMGRDERRVYDLIDGVTTIGHIMDLSMLTEFDLYKALHALAAKNLIERTSRAGSSHAHGYPVNRLAGSPAAIELWKAIRNQSGHMSPNAAAVAITLSKQSAMLAQGSGRAEPWMEIALRVVEDMSAKLNTWRAGAFEYINGDLAIAIMWNRESDFAFVLLDRVENNGSSISRFRSYAAKVSACLLAAA